jgi:hypothetical protein
MSGQNSSSRRRHGGEPTLYNHRPDTATLVRVSDDGQRARVDTVTVARVKTPAYFQEDYATNAGLDGRDFDYSMGDTTLDAEEQAPEDDGISVRVKAKRYQNSVHKACFLYIRFSQKTPLFAFSRTCRSRHGWSIEMSISMRCYTLRAEGTKTCTRLVEGAGSSIPHFAAKIRHAMGRNCSVDAASSCATRSFQPTGSRCVLFRTPSLFICLVGRDL